MEELDNLFQNHHIENSDNELQELQELQELDELQQLIINKEMLEFLCKENINDLNFLIEDKINIGKNINLKQFLHRLEKKNKIYLNDMTFDITDKIELNIKNKIEKICKLKIEDDVKLYMIETYMLLANILSYLD